MNLKEKRCIWEGLGEGKEREKHNQIIISKKKWKHWQPLLSCMCRKGVGVQCSWDGTWEWRNRMLHCLFLGSIHGEAPRMFISAGWEMPRPNKELSEPGSWWAAVWDTEDMASLSQVCKTEDYKTRWSTRGFKETEELPAVGRARVAESPDCLGGRNQSWNEKERIKSDRSSRGYSRNDLVMVRNWGRMRWKDNGLWVSKPGLV